MKWILLTLFMFLPVVAQAEGFDWAGAFSPGGIIAVVIVLGVEALAGATDWFKSGSILELVKNMVLKLFKKETVL